MLPAWPATAEAGAVNEQLHFLITVGTGPVATADVTRHGGDVDVHFHVDGGHAPPGTRARLMAQVFARPELRGCRRLHASMPIGDAELLEELRRRCSAQSTRAAGASCLIEGSLDATGE